MFTKTISMANDMLVLLLNLNQNIDGIAAEVIKKIHILYLPLKNMDGIILNTLYYTII